ncbi:MAG: GNAT family N-acetyltransferase [Acidimicrobiia bacterium]
MNRAVFTPIETSRLLIRPLIAEDAAELARRRSDPEVARYQNWTVPYPVERAETMVASNVAMDGPENGEWWMAAVCDRASGEVLGDLALHMSEDGRTAEIGYTFDSKNWGHGYASEAVDAFLGYLFHVLKVTRVFGMLHPDNPASAMVLERNGFLFEGHTRSSFWLNDEVSDDLIYGLLPTDWEDWKNRPQDPPERVELIEITAENYDTVAKLVTHKSQESFVAPMLWSYADALFPEVVDGAPVVPWMRAITADSELAGFVMLALSTEHHPDPYLWRLLVDRRHQRRGVGGQALDLVEAEMRARGDSTLYVSWEEGKGSPAPMYLKRGFETTGRIVEGETEAKKQLS